MTSTLIPNLRRGPGTSRVGTVELFYDLVYVFAVTQLSRSLVEHPTPDGAFRAAILLLMVWEIWVYTTWSMTYLDPSHGGVRLVLIALMFGSLLIAAALPQAFGDSGDSGDSGDRGLLIAIAFVAIQLGRAAATIWAFRRDELRGVFARVLPWSAASGVLVIAGGLCDGHARELCWLAAVVVDASGSGVGFWLPGVGRSTTRQWTIDGGHFAERCQAFVLIALGESVVVIGELARLDDTSAGHVVAFLLTFAGVVALWWVYFDRSAERSSRTIEAASNPGRLARNAFHLVHPVIVAGIISTAAADELVLEDPEKRGDPRIAWLILGGVGLFLAGHAAFKWAIWHTVSWPRVGGVVAVALLGLLAPHVSAVVLGLCAGVVVVCVVVADRMLHTVESWDSAAGDG